MQFLTVALVAAGLVAPSMAAPVVERSAVPAGYQWSVSQWNSGCNDEHCIFSFYVTGPKHGNIPGFAARCNGLDNSEFLNCKVRTSSEEVEVEAKLRTQKHPSNPTGPAKMSLRLGFTLEESGVEMVYTGSHNAVYNWGAYDDNTTFKVIPTHVTGN